MTGVLTRRGEGHSHRGKKATKTGAETGARGRWEPPGAGRGKEGCSPGASGGGMTLLTPRFCPSGFQNGERTNFSCFSFLRFFIKMWTIFKVFLQFVTILILCYVVFFFFFFSHKACGIFSPWPRIHLAPPALEGGVLTTGQPRKSQFLLF